MMHTCQKNMVDPADKSTLKHSRFTLASRADIGKILPSGLLVSKLRIFLTFPWEWSSIHKYIALLASISTPLLKAVYYDKSTP